MYTSVTYPYKLYISVHIKIYNLPVIATTLSLSPPLSLSLSLSLSLLFSFKICQYKKKMAEQIFSVFMM